MYQFIFKRLVFQQPICTKFIFGDILYLELKDLDFAILLTF